MWDYWDWVRVDRHLRDHRVSNRVDRKTGEMDIGLYVFSSIYYENERLRRENDFIDEGDKGKPGHKVDHKVWN